MKNLLTMTVILLASGMAIAEEDEGLWIAKHIDQADSGWQSEQVQSTMILRSSDGREVVREIRSRSIEVSGDGDKSLVIFDKPGDVRGTVFLTYSHKSGDDDQWLYLPALKRVKRISSSNRAGPFMGSEFAYEDISSEEVERYRYRFLREDKCGENLECYVFERYPLDENSGYSKQIVYADKEFFRIHKIQYFDRKETHQKTLVRTNYEKFGDYWRAAQWEMVNHQTGKTTMIFWNNRQFGNQLTANDFDKSAMERAR